MSKRLFLSSLNRQMLWRMPCRLSNTLSNETLEKQRKSVLSHTKEERTDAPLVAPRDYKFVYPEFLPESNWQHRDRIREIVERKDMVRRREVLHIPEFYVGSILAVTVSDEHAPGKKNRFVGLCIQRSGHGLRANFTLRNVIDEQGIEVMYEMYNPMLLSIDVLKLERRLDEELFYLRDAPPQYSTVPFNMETVAHPPGAAVPINTMKVPLNPPPWDGRWERNNLQGAILPPLPAQMVKKAQHPQVVKAWEKHDLMKQYRESINDEDTEDIMSEVYTNMSRIEKKRAKNRFSSSKAGKNA